MADPIVNNDSEEEDKINTVEEVNELMVEIARAISGLINSMMTVKGFFSKDVFDAILYCHTEHELVALEVNIAHQMETMEKSDDPEIPDDLGEVDAGLLEEIKEQLETYIDFISKAMLELSVSLSLQNTRAKCYLLEIPKDLSEFLESQRKFNFDHYRKTIDSIVNAIHLYCIKTREEFGFGPINPKQDPLAKKRCCQYPPVPAIEYHDPADYDPPEEEEDEGDGTA